MDKLPIETQTLYAELMDQLAAVEAHRSIGSLPGTFVSKEVKGESYWYFQYFDPGGARRQVYVGRRSRPLDEVVERHRAGRIELRADIGNLERLCALLRAGGALLVDGASSRVLRALAESGVFRLGGILVGTQAFIVLGNLLGTRWGGSVLRTHDIDIAGESTMSIALPDLRADIPGALASLEMGFLPVPPLDPKHPTTSFKVRGQPLRVDVLCPATGKGPRGPVHIPRFNAAAQPLRFLDFLIQRPVQGAVVSGYGVLVTVPDAGRFGLHKLIVSQERSAAEHQKTDKDLAQAGQVLSFLAEERPGDVRLAWDEVRRRGAGWERRVRRGLAMLARKRRADHEKILALIADA